MARHKPLPVRVAAKLEGEADRLSEILAAKLLSDAEDAKDVGVPKTLAYFRANWGDTAWRQAMRQRVGASAFIAAAKAAGLGYTPPIPPAGMPPPGAFPEEDAPPPGAFEGLDTGMGGLSNPPYPIAAGNPGPVGEPAPGMVEAGGVHPPAPTGPTSPPDTTAMLMELIHQLGPDAVRAALAEHEMMAGVPAAAPV